MIEITFNYNGEDLYYSCNDNKQTIKDIFLNLKKEVDFDKIVFLYSATPIDINLSVAKIINNHDSNRNKMTILVNDQKDENQTVCMIHSSDIICPKCGESAKFDISEYKIILQCQKGHNKGNIFLDQFEETQQVDISKIICGECKTNNKANSYKNLFYRCSQCRLNLCLTCQKRHQNEYKDHNIINYDDKNYICEKHNDKYSSYCFNCKKNICIFCEKEHEKYKGHIYKDYVKMLPDMKEAKTNLEELRNKINEFKIILDGLINKLNKIKNTIEYFYKIDKDLFDLLNKKRINNEVLWTFSKINLSGIITDINDIIGQKDSNEIFKNINELYNKMTNKFCEEITIQYKIENNNKIDIFGEKFVDINKDNCSFEINGKEYELKDKIELINLSINNNDKNFLEIKLKGIQNLTNISYMFDGCSSLISLPDISNINTSKVFNMQFMFAGCSSLKILPDISRWNTMNVKSMKAMFFSCESLISLPDISKWNISNVSDMVAIFDSCVSLKTLPDISKWNISKVKNLANMFTSCKSLLSLPDLSKWNTINVENINMLFFMCSSLKILPDISIWNLLNVKEMNGMFIGCSSLISLPDISKWNTANVTNMGSLFAGCSSIKSLPDISIWKTVNVTNMENMFTGCSLLISLPDISKWNTANVTNMESMFAGCSTLISLPDLSKWNISNVKRDDMFAGCSKLEKIPEFFK